MRSVPAAPLAASRSSALPLVCSAAAALKASGEVKPLAALLDEPDEPDGPEDDEAVEPPVPVDAALVVKLGEAEAAVGEN